MAHPSKALLHALYSANTSTGRSVLSHDEINELGDMLWIPRSDLLELVAQFQREGLVTVHFSGGLSLTAKGKEHASGEAGNKEPSVHFGDIGAGAQVFYQNRSPGAVAGHGAMGPHSHKVEAPLGEAPLGELAAALLELRKARTQLDGAAKEPARAVETELKATLQEAQQQTPDKPGLIKHVEQLSGLTKHLSELTEGASKLKPAVSAIRGAITALNLWLGVKLGVPALGLG